MVVIRFGCWLVLLDGYDVVQVGFGCEVDGVDYWYEGVGEGQCGVGFVVFVDFGDLFLVFFFECVVFD